MAEEDDIDGLAADYVLGSLEEEIPLDATTLAA